MNQLDHDIRSNFLVILPIFGQGGDGRARRAVRALRQAREERRGRLRLGGRRGLALHQVTTSVKLCT